MKNNGLYDNGRNLFALGDIKWKPGGSTIKVMLIDPTIYTPNLNLHKTLEDIPYKAIIPVSRSRDISQMPELSLVTATNGICDASDLMIKKVTKGYKIGYLILVNDTGLDEKNNLICCCNIGGEDNFFISSGRPIIISWSNMPNKIFKL
jgi:hypothetical protein